MIILLGTIMGMIGKAMLTGIGLALGFYIVQTGFPGYMRNFQESYVDQGQGLFKSLIPLSYFKALVMMEERNENIQREVSSSEINTASSGAY